MIVVLTFVHKQRNNNAICLFLVEKNVFKSYDLKPREKKSRFV